MKNSDFRNYTCFPELVSVPNYNQTLKTDFSKTPRHKLKLIIYTYKVNLALSEYNLNFNTGRVVFEKLAFKV